MYIAKIYVTYKPSILDPKGESIKSALHRLNYETVTDVTMGKYFELKLEADAATVESTVQAICDQLLVNVNMETYRYEIEALEVQ
ncbi:phosphoribosylformylglycinamidine synthase subunit PurS [Agrilactobacillus yilanensis]|uniref:Phosphoribosylformylglycinamidine synthase subunit PurS n=1 Tax=Agrilactobacillus yilanensis TaxID=2485997 RepID=A0ABW4JAT0_9LACO|nr:phosphoribosylformylglycinamidine synthase subunit PurS [Agrilactobacillus yilanensis]